MQGAQWRHGRVAIWRLADLGAQVCGLSLRRILPVLDERITCRGWDCRSTSRRGCYSVRQEDSRGPTELAFLEIEPDALASQRRDTEHPVDARRVTVEGAIERPGW